MSAMPDFPPPEFEPSGLGHDLLLDWAPWARDDRREEPSWSAEWSGRPRIDHEYGGDPPEDFWIVDKIVAPQRRDGTTYWHVASRFYLGEKSYAQITIDLGKNWPEKRVRLNLVCFAELVGREYLDFKEEASRIRNRRVRLLRAR
jgi:hypothetical protein